jgi:transcriptional regulator with XRE-family HTH domain
MTTDKKFKYRFCSNILKILDEQGMKQGELAKKVGCRKETMSHWLNGYSMPNIYATLKIAEVLGISIDELVKGGEQG